MSLNLWSLEYLLEVAKTGSISRAAQNLFLSQPHLSNTIKSVEKELGTPLFRRSAKGMALTEEGVAFIREARKILDQVEQLESMFYVRPGDSVRLNVSVTRSYQINRCITAFINQCADKPQLLFHVKETNPFQVLEDVRTRVAELGVLHFFDAQQEYFLNCFKTYALHYEKQYEREYLVVMSAENPLAKEPRLDQQMLGEQTVVIYGDYEAPSASYQTVSQSSDIVFSSKRIYVYDRATAMETLSRCPCTYMWITGMHPDTLERERLILRRCPDVNVRNLGYSISCSDGELTRSARALLEMMKQIDWTETVS